MILKVHATSHKLHIGITSRSRHQLIELRPEMTTLEDITEHLLNRAQEAVLQLEVWISEQQNFQKIDCRDESSQLRDMYSIYVAQLNSLCMRSEFVVKKLNNEHRRHSSKYGNRKYIEDLVYEFQDITTRLNDLALTQHKDSTPCSKSSKDSCDSFQPKPLKITERHRSYMEAARLSPTKKDTKKRVVVISESPKNDYSSSKCFSLPGSPIKESGGGAIRLAKSYDTGLNKKSPSTSKGSVKPEFKSFFKENQRLSLSLSFLDGDDLDEEYTSDQDTVISVSPHPGEKFTPLRRYNSHESILSVKNKVSNKTKTFPSFFCSRSNAPSMKSARISSAPVISKSRSPACSRDLLSAFVKNSSHHQETCKDPQTSFFTKWNPFSLTTSRNKESQTNHLIKQNISSQQWKEDNETLGNRSHLAVQRIIRETVAGVPREPIEPIFDSMIAYEDLQDALNTELIL